MSEVSFSLGRWTTDSERNKHAINPCRSWLQTSSVIWKIDWQQGSDKDPTRKFKKITQPIRFLALACCFRAHPLLQNVVSIALGNIISQDFLMFCWAQQKIRLRNNHTEERTTIQDTKKIEHRGICCLANSLTSTKDELLLFFSLLVSCDLSLGSETTLYNPQFFKP